MKILRQLFVLSVVATLTLAEPDWAAVKAKYDEIEANWRSYTEQASEAMKAEADALLLASAEQVLKTFMNKGQVFYATTVYMGIEGKNLTPEQVVEFRDKLTELANQVHEDFKPIQGKFKPETQKKLDELWEESKKYRYQKDQEVVDLLKV